MEACEYQPCCECTCTSQVPGSLAYQRSLACIGLGFLKSQRALDSEMIGHMVW